MLSFLCVTFVTLANERRAAYTPSPFPGTAQGGLPPSKFFFILFFHPQANFLFFPHHPTLIFFIFFHPQSPLYSFLCCFCPFFSLLTGFLCLCVYFIVRGFFVALRAKKNDELWA